MRELAARAEATEERALARREHGDIEDAEFDDRPVRALGRSERAHIEPVVREIIRERESSWMPLAVGLGVVALIGVAGVVVYLLVRRKGNGETSTLGAIDPRYVPQPMQQQAPQIYVINTGSGAVTTPQTSVPLPELPPRPVAYPSTTPMLHRLPATTNATAEALAAAGAHAIEVNVAAVEPSGATALLAFSPDMSNAIAIRVGEERRIRIDRGRTLYGKGQTIAVTATVASTS